jgi:hypothetical protein
VGEEFADDEDAFDNPWPHRSQNLAPSGASWPHSGQVIMRR